MASVISVNVSSSKGTVKTPVKEIKVIEINGKNILDVSTGIDKLVCSLSRVMPK